MTQQPNGIHPIYSGEPKIHDSIEFDDGEGSAVKLPLAIKIIKPTKEDGTVWDQTNDAADHMRYAHSLNLPQLVQAQLPKRGSVIIVGGAPSIKDHLDQIRELSKNPRNFIFAINWTHTWLIQNGIVPNATVFFEIDTEPESVLKNAHKDVTYYICSHCDPRTFDQLKGFKRILWHSYPNSRAEEIVREELFANSSMCGGGIGTFTRTLTVAMFLGYRDFEIFGCDSSFPDHEKTHVEGYETVMDSKVDGIWIYAKNDSTGEVKRFRTIGPLALQHEEFKEYCRVNHAYFTMRVHGNGLLPWSHRQTYPSMYE
jgi:Protein of unknown function DUF115